MESAGAGSPGMEIEERVQEHTAMLHHLGTAIDRVVRTMDRWERRRFPPAPPPAQQGPPLLTPPAPVLVGFASPSPGRTMGRQPAARVSCYTLEWANAVWVEGDAVLDHFEEFTHRFQAVTTAPMPMELGVRPPAVDDWYQHAEETWDAAHVHLQRAKLRQKAGADRHRSEAPVFAPGDRVWLSTRNLPLRLNCRKWDPRFVGPFKVLRRLNEAGGGWLAPEDVLDVDVLDPSMLQEFHRLHPDRPASLPPGHPRGRCQLLEPRVKGGGVLSGLLPKSVPLLVRAVFGGRRHRSSSHRRSIFHFPFVLSCFPTHLVFNPVFVWYCLL
ncbi:uncharacterized protein ACWYII_040580 [Salvelinus alpinus]